MPITAGMLKELLEGTDRYAPVNINTAGRKLGGVIDGLNGTYSLIVYNTQRHTARDGRISFLVHVHLARSGTGDSPYRVWMLRDVLRTVPDDAIVQARAHGSSTDATVFGDHTLVIKEAYRYETERGDEEFTFIIEQEE